MKPHRSQTHTIYFQEGLDCYPLSNNQVEMQLITPEIERYPSDTDWG